MFKTHVALAALKLDANLGEMLQTHSFVSSSPLKRINLVIGLLFVYITLPRLLKMPNLSPEILLNNLSPFIKTLQELRMLSRSLSLIH